jgi:hypothetical protein
MPDISKCNGVNCPLKETCYRYTSEPSEFWQAYSDFDKHREESGEDCEYYWPVAGGRRAYG